MKQTKPINLAKQKQQKKELEEERNLKSYEHEQVSSVDIIFKRGSSSAVDFTYCILPFWILVGSLAHCPLNL